MVKQFFSFFALLVVLLVNSGCENQNSPVSSTEASSSNKNLARNPNGPSTAPYDATISYTITLIADKFDPVTEQTTFTWEVTSGSAPSISHWGLINLCEDINSSIFIGGSEQYGFGYDGSTGFSDMLKFDTGYDDEETRIVTLVLDGNWASGPVDILVKSGNGYILGTTMGPVCGSTETPTYSLSGYTYFDANGNGQKDLTEPAVPSVSVNLNNGSTATSDANGFYSFSNLTSGSYVVAAGSVTGLVGPNPASHDVTITNANVENVNFGYVLDLTWIGNQTANGFTIGYWKTNIDKAIKGQTKGVQVSKATLEAYVGNLSTFALSPLNVTSLSAASGILSATSSVPASLLSKQLMGSEFNYQNGAYIGGNELVTYLFVYYGEYILANSANYSSEQILSAKDMYDAYNNSHGGQIVLQ
jgi:hypothetical protein